MTKPSRTTNHDVDRGTKGSTRSFVRAGISFVIVVASLAWIFRVVSRTGLEFESAWEVDGIGLVVAGILGVGSAAMKGAILALILQRREREAPLTRTIGVFLASEVVRYLPGRLWGLVYSAVRLSDVVPQKSVWWANLEHFLVSNLNSLGIGLAVVFWYLGMPSLGIVILVLAWLLLIAELKSHVFARWLVSFTGRVPTEREQQSRFAARLFVLLQAEWIAYLSIWLVLMLQRWSLLDVTLFAVLYAMAWLVGLIAFIVPGGVFVREAAFVWLGVQFGFDLGDLAVMAGIARVLFLGVDLVSFGLGLILSKRRSVHGLATNRV